MGDIDQIREAIIKFRDERDWEQFHNAKDLALALSIEAAELNQLFLWKSPEEVDRNKAEEELADVFNYAVLLADRLGVDIKSAVLEKIRKNGEKYPVEKAKGSARKYTEL